MYKRQGGFCDDHLIFLSEFFLDHTELVLLLSGSNYDSAQFSFLALFPLDKFSIDFTEEMTVNPWDILKKKLQFTKELGAMPEWFGYLCYEMGAFHDLDCQIACHPLDIPLAQFSRYAVVIRLNKYTGEICININEKSLLSNEKKALVDLFKKEDFLDTIYKIFNQKKKNNLQKGEIEKFDTLESYSNKIQKAKEYIFEGDIYQINLSQKFESKGSFDVFEIFKNIFLNNPAPFSAYLQIDEIAFISSSPERLLKKEDKLLETRPIKGTLPRGMTPKEDAFNKNALLNSEKNRSELLMITDLMRNDLSKISESGSVKVKEIFKCEQYTNVFHLLSVIQGVLKKKIHPVDALRAVFPGGSITGCPKIRSMQIIHELEGESRGIYTGSIGYFAGNGDFDFNIAIRTLYFSKNESTFRLGGAIMAESCEKEEFEETLHKGLSIFEAMNNNTSMKLFK